VTHFAFPHGGFCDSFFFLPGPSLQMDPSELLCSFNGTPTEFVPLFHCHPPLPCLLTSFFFFELSFFLFFPASAAGSSPNSLQPHPPHPLRLLFLRPFPGSAFTLPCPTTRWAGRPIFGLFFSFSFSLYVTYCFYPPCCPPLLPCPVSFFPNFP